MIIEMCVADTLSGKNSSFFETEYKNVLRGGKAEVNMGDFVERTRYFELVKFSSE